MSSESSKNESDLDSTSTEEETNQHTDKMLRVNKMSLEATEEEISKIQIDNSK